MTQHPSLHWPAFLFSFFAAPLIVTALTFWAAYIPYYALLLGGPVYVVFGLPLLVWHLHRHPPQIIRIILIALLSLLAVPPLAVLMAAIYDEWDALEALPAFMLFGALFAALWSGTFALLYIRLTR